jgi:hypothetical protein
MKSGTETIHFIHHKDKPSDRKATYLRVCANFRPQKADPMRIRFTVGGDRIKYDGKVTTPTADLTNVKIILNSILPAPEAKFMTADIKDFYLNTPMPRFEYMRIPVHNIPDVMMTQYELAPLVQNVHVMVEIRKGMYGLPQAGLIANERLIEYLAKYGYTPTKNTPGLFQHATRPITFALVVDDFGVKYVDQANAQHLISAIQDLYTCTTDWTGSLYIGLTLKWDYTTRTCDTSMPGYIQKAITKFKVQTPARPQHSPHAWQAPTYGAPIQFTEPDDTSPELPPTDKTRIQESIEIGRAHA